MGSHGLAWFLVKNFGPCTNFKSQARLFILDQPEQDFVLHMLHRVHAEFDPSFLQQVTTEKFSTCLHLPFNLVLLVSTPTTDYNQSLLSCIGIPYGQVSVKKPFDHWQGHSILEAIPQ